MRSKKRNVYLDKVEGVERSTRLLKVILFLTIVVAVASLFMDKFNLWREETLEKKRIIESVKLLSDDKYYLQELIQKYPQFFGRDVYSYGVLYWCKTLEGGKAYILTREILYHFVSQYGEFSKRAGTTSPIAHD